MIRQSWVHVLEMESAYYAYYAIAVYMWDTSSRRRKNINIQNDDRKRENESGSLISSSLLINNFQSTI